MQLTEIAVINTQAINETRFQYSRQENQLNAVAAQAAVNVLDAFTGGGASVGQSLNNLDRFELQNYTTFVLGRHTLKAGASLRYFRIRDIAPQNFNGTFTFSGGLAPLLDANNQIVLDVNGQPAQTTINSIERYRRPLLFQQQGLTTAQIRALGGGATQFSIASGNAEARINQAEFGLFIQDEWNLRPNLNLSLGLRYDAQSNIKRKFNLVPRIAFGYAPRVSSDGKTNTVIRGGFGIFFDRVSENLILQANHFNNGLEQQFISSDPNILGIFPAVPPLALLANSTASSTSIQVAPDLQLPYLM